MTNGRQSFRWLTIVAISLSLAAASEASSEDPVEVKVRASDGASSDSFGSSVGTDGATVIVGATGDADAGTATGAAYLFDAGSGQPLLKLTASDGAADDYFGTSVAVDGQTAIVGSRWDDDAGDRSGSAYLFDVPTGRQLTKLVPQDAAAGDTVGISAALDGTTAIVGATQAFNTGAGAAYLFDVSTGQQLFKLTPSDGAPNDDFGQSVGISGTYAIVGSPNHSGVGQSSGAVYVFDVTTGQQLFKLTASDADGFDSFGISAGISGTFAIVGAPGNGDAGTKSGSAYLFDVTSGQELFKLTAADATAFDQFGRSCAISGTRAIVGAPYDHVTGHSGAGSAYLFDVATGQQLDKLTASDRSFNDNYGFSVAASTMTLVSGAWHDDDRGMDSGSAYLYVQPPEIHDLTPSRGPRTGGNTITITGSAFQPSSSVSFGGVPGSVTFVSKTRLQVVVPPLPTAPTFPVGGSPRRLAVDVDVEVTTAVGFDTAFDAYSYVLKK